MELSGVDCSTDISDHFSQVCVIKSAIDKFKGKSIKLRDYSKFSAVCFSDDLSNVHRDDILSSGKNNVDVLFPSFYNKFNPMVKNVLMIKISNRKRKVLFKPWITTGSTEVSIRMKSQLYASGDKVRYKYYRIKISSLIRRISKNNYYRQ